MIKGGLGIWRFEGYRRLGSPEVSRLRVANLSRHNGRSGILRTNSVFFGSDEAMVTAVLEVELKRRARSIENPFGRGDLLASPGHSGMATDQQNVPPNAFSFLSCCYSRMTSAKFGSCFQMSPGARNVTPWIFFSSGGP